MKIGFITSELDPHLIEDDLLAVPFLKDKGLEVVPVVWDNTSPAALQGLSALIFRSVWNYHRKGEAFLSWCDELTHLNIPIFNPVEILKWNFHKKYLFELASKGVNIPQTVLLQKSGDIELLKQFTCDEVVVKPVVSLNGHDTYRMKRNDWYGIESKVQGIISEREVLIQEYVPEITTKGELSFLFFNGKFSHALRKVASPGEFRIHSEYGGSRIPYDPPEDYIQTAQEILRASGFDVLYARVDVVESSRGLLLIELELLDPMLYLGYSEGAPERLAAAVHERLKNR